VKGMKNPDRAEKDLYIKDMALLIIFLFLTIAVFGFVLLQVLYLQHSNILAGIVLIVSSITAISMVWASGEVMMHLRRNRSCIYNEDLICQKYILEQKRLLAYEKQ
jgi:cytochrome c biogenesis protein CcdA